MARGSRKTRAKRKARTPSLSDYAKWFASRGGTARAKKLTAAERRAIGKKGAAARWARAKKQRS